MSDRKRIMLVYQTGIANVFEVECFNLSDYGREAKRIYQGDFHTAASIATGAGIGGAIVRTASCNVAGECANAKWEDGINGTPFRDDATEVRMN